MPSHFFLSLFGKNSAALRKKAYRLFGLVYFSSQYLQR